MLLDDFKAELQQNGLFIKDNVLDDIFELYKANEYFAKISNNYPVTKESVIADINDAPPTIEKERKFFLSIYNEDGALAAVMDYLDKYSYQNKDNEDAVWIGLLQTNSNLHRRGLGRNILSTFENACKKNGKQLIQLGVIKENQIGIDFWKKQGFITFTEKRSGNLDLFLMEKNI